MIVVISGLPGTGKTTVAKELGEEIGAPVLTTDEIRKKASGKNKYAPKKKHLVYDRMLRMAGDVLSEKESVVLDGTFFKRKLRMQARRLGIRKDRCAFILEVTCDEQVVKKRIEKRYKENKDASEADFKVHKIIRNRFEPIREEHYTLDTGDGARWKKKLLDTANKMRVTEKQEKVIQRLMEGHDMKLLQTHISWVLLDGRNAYKIKKPVRFSFVDYSSLEKREHFCRKENEINSRLCPDLYLGTASVRKDDGCVTLDHDESGKTVEFAVKMKELPQEERMDSLLWENKVGRRHMDDIAGILADFHADTAFAPGKLGTPEIIKENFSPSFEAGRIMKEFFEAGEKVDFIRSRVEEFLRKNRKLLEGRIADGRIKYCHGDVRAKNIFIHEGRVYLFDAVEFNERISGCDVAAEIAFLAMDLDFYGRSDLGRKFFDSYLSRTGDREIEGLIDFYMCYRAMVEALVQSYILEDPEVSREKKGGAAEDCEKYVGLASGYAEKL